MDRPSEEIFAELRGWPSSHHFVPSACLSKDLDSLVFLGVAEQCGYVKELARHTERTVQAVYGRLEKLGLSSEDVDASPKLEARKVELQRGLAPALPWIQALIAE